MLYEYLLDIRKIFLIVSIFVTISKFFLKLSKTNKIVRKLDH